MTAITEGVLNYLIPIQCTKSTSLIEMRRIVNG